MEIVYPDQYPKRIEFCELSPGDTFMYPNGFRVYMKLDDGNHVNLADGKTYECVGTKEMIQV
jgi:hypothetical protein